MFTDLSQTPLVGEAVTKLRRLARNDPVGNRFLESLRENRATTENFRRLVGVTHKCHPAEITGFATVMSRFPSEQNVAFLCDMVLLINRARPKLRRVIEAFGMTEEDVRNWPPDHLAYEVPGFWERAALLGNQSQTALALYWDMVNYFPDSDEMLRLLGESSLEMIEEVAWYYEGGQSDELELQALLTAEEGLARGEPVDGAVIAARRMEEAIAAYWYAAARSADDAENDC
ncbi:hypothetical protein ACWFMI_05255 [Nocardiopsis terrae]